MNILLLIVPLLAASLYATPYTEFSQAYQAQRYDKACQIGKRLFAKERDEKFLSLIGHACLQADYIDTLAMIQSRLRSSKSARENAVIFASILLQKRLIYQFMYDDTDISSLTLPISDHPLSHAFVAIRDDRFTLRSKTPKIIEFHHNGIHYRLYIDRSNKGRVTIEAKDADHHTTIHRYL